MTSLIQPRIPTYNQSLLAAVELKRWKLPSFSDAHWIMQLIIEYSNLFRDNHSGADLTPWGKQSACAIEDVFETLLRRGAKAAAARAQALKDDGFPILTWFPGPEGGQKGWAATRKRALAEGYYSHVGD